MRRLTSFSKGRSGRFVVVRAGRTGAAFERQVRMFRDVGKRKGGEVMSMVSRDE